MDLTIQQAIFRPAAPLDLRWPARSGGFADEWRPWAEQLADGFGEQPAGFVCPDCLFAYPFGPRHVAVVQVAEDPGAITGAPRRYRFRLLVLCHDLYRALGDPFAVADRFPPPWDSRGELPVLEWPPEPLPPRTVPQVQHALKEGDSEFLLGATQALLDGGHILLERPAPAGELLRNLWLLLPASTRAELWPTTYAFGTGLAFHVAAAPPGGRGEPDPGAVYLTEEQVRDYPPGRYELNLQIAAEAGDRKALDRLFARRSSRETLRLAFFLVIATGVLAVAMRIVSAMLPGG
jgi:hypothetical protein